ncbi:hypothetical protein LR48_Vigan09g079500 [Vigna angularis]|uniref:Uncharacterized protein n=1 Tax=Phaseolus angularis TaxID=3914 RepID=A0A0L9VAP3_PHAAN|nr:hypothetical protein LR48_Vigan09g079500 [Vigna angularis]
MGAFMIEAVKGNWDELEEELNIKKLELRKDKKSTEEKAAEGRKCLGALFWGPQHRMPRTHA